MIIKLSFYAEVATLIYGVRGSSGVHKFAARRADSNGTGFDHFGPIGTRHGPKRVRKWPKTGSSGLWGSHEIFILPGGQHRSMAPCRASNSASKTVSRSTPSRREPIFIRARTRVGYPILAENGYVPTCKYPSIGHCFGVFRTSAKVVDHTSVQ